MTCSNRLQFETPEDQALRPGSGENGPGEAGSFVPSYNGVPIPYLNGSVTSTEGWVYEDDAGTRWNSTKDLRNFWDSMVLNYRVLVTAMINATYDANYSSKASPALANAYCIAPSGVGTGKGFTFSGTVPANANAEQASGGDEGIKTEEDKDNSAMGLSPANWAWAAAMVPALGFWVL